MTSAKTFTVTVSGGHQIEAEMIKAFITSSE
jgi:hypothetical protein